MNRDNAYLIVNYIFLFVATCWIPVQAYLLKMDASGRSLFALIAVMFLFNFNHRSFWTAIFNTPVITRIFWAVYVFISALYQGYDNTKANVMLFDLVVPISVMIAINAAKYNDRLIVYNIIIAGMTLNLLLTMVNIPSLSQFQANRNYEVLRINQNDFGIAALVLFIIVVLKNRYGELKQGIFYLLLIVPTGGIFLSGSRNAFTGLIIFLASLFFFLPEGRKIKLLKMAIGIPVFLVVFFFALNHSVVGERLAGTREQGETMNLNSGTIFDKLGDRGVFYVLGYQVFKEHPVFGIGLDNFPKFSGYFKQHSEYMFQLSELGLVGTLLFLLLYFQTGRGILRVRYKDNDKAGTSLKYMHLVALLVIIFIGLFIRVYNSIYIFLLLGILIEFTRSRPPIDNSVDVSDEKLF